MKLNRDFLSLSSLNIFVTAINVGTVFLIGRFGDEVALAAMFFAYSTLQLLVNVASFRTDSLLARYGYGGEPSLNRTVLIASQLLDVAGAILYGSLVLLLYRFIEPWFTQKFAVSGYLTLFILSWLVYIGKQTVYGVAVASRRFTLVAVQGAIAALLRPTSLLLFIYCGFDVFTAAALMYLVSELVSLLLLLLGVRDLLGGSEKRPLPQQFWTSSWHLYASSTLKVNDNNFNESVLPIIAEPKLAACLLLLRKAFALVSMLVQPLSTLMLGKLSQLGGRNLEEIMAGIRKTNGLILLLGSVFILVVSALQGWLGILAGFAEWQVSFELALLFGVSLLLRYLLWWVQPVFSIFSIPMLYLFNALMIVFLGGVYLLAASHLTIESYICGSIVFYIGINALVMYRLKSRQAGSLDPA